MYWYGIWSASVAPVDSGVRITCLIRRQGKAEPKVYTVNYKLCLLCTLMG